MTDTTMPAAEAAMAHDTEQEFVSYEFAFHVLPTVAEGEVGEVFDGLKQLISKYNGEVFDEEAPKRFDLAYDIVKHLEGKNRKFSSAYFGWVRFRLDPAAMEELAAEIDAHRQLLRYLIIRLTRVEEEHPFRFHDALDTKRVTTVSEDGEVIDAVEPEVTESAEEETTENTAEAAPQDETATVNDDELEEALKKDEV